MEYSFYARIEIKLKISVSEVDYIVQACKSHYDGKVQSATEPGGFVYGMNNRKIWASEKGDKDIEENLSFHQIDLLCKAVEFSRDEAEWKIFSAFSKILHAINSKALLVNEELQKEPNTVY